jgi:hypothetical protein
VEVRKLIPSCFSVLEPDPNRKSVESHFFLRYPDQKQKGAACRQPLIKTIDDNLLLHKQAPVNYYTLGHQLYRI